MAKLTVNFKSILIHIPCTADGDALSFKDDISKEEIEVNYIFPLLRSLF